jgi:hypothetical protein
MPDNAMINRLWLTGIPDANKVMGVERFRLASVALPAQDLSGPARCKNVAFFTKTAVVHGPCQNVWLSQHRLSLGQSVPGAL